MIDPTPGAPAAPLTVFLGEKYFFVLICFTYQHRRYRTVAVAFFISTAHATALQVLCADRVWGHIRANRLSTSVGICTGIVLQRAIDTRRGPFLNCHIL